MSCIKKDILRATVLFITQGTVSFNVSLLPVLQTSHYIPCQVRVSGIQADLLYSLKMIKYKRYGHQQQISNYISQICFKYIVCVSLSNNDNYRLRLRLRQGFIQHKITHGSFTSGLHYKTIRTYWTNMNLTCKKACWELY